MTAKDQVRAAQAAAWPAATELLAQLVELTAVLAADMRLKGQPRRVPRPGFLAGGGQDPARGADAGRRGTRTGSRTRSGC